MPRDHETLARLDRPHVFRKLLICVAQSDFLVHALITLRNFVARNVGRGIAAVVVALPSAWKAR
jgi:hypothetical protein